MQAAFLRLRIFLIKLSKTRFTKKGNFILFLPNLRRISITLLSYNLHSYNILIKNSLVKITGYKSLKNYSLLVNIADPVAGPG